MKMKKIFTSYYANVRNLPSDLVPIGISVGKNRYFKGDYMLELAPTWAMMKMDREGYDKAFLKKLSQLNAKEIYERLPDGAVLLCYEKYNDWCHRRCVGEWLERELGIEVTEWGLERHECFPYSECCEANKGKKRKIADASKTDGSVSKRNLESYEPSRDLFDFDFSKKG